MANAFDEDESNMTQVSRVSIKAFLINVEDRTDRYKQSSSQLNQA